MSVARALIAAGFMATIVACGESTAPSLPIQVALAKGGTTTQRADFSITDAHLAGDGNGTYVDGTCGVWGSSTSDLVYLAPAEAKIPRSQKTSCMGIAPRTASLSLAVRHLTDSPHIDDSQSPAGSGVFDVANIKLGWGTAQAVIINALGTCETVGLRFAPATYPGTDTVVREDLGGGLWRMHTRPWPDNRAYCVIGGVATYWHVDMDVQVQIHAN